MPSETGTEPRLWARLCLVLRASSQERLAGWWSTREDWIQLELEPAMVTAVNESRSGYAVLVVETWARCHELREEVWALAEAGWAPASKWSWLTLELPESGTSQAAGQTYLHRLRPAKAANYGRVDRRAWSVYAYF